MNRRNFYYRQLVAEADMDEVFDLAEDADRALMVDQGVIGILDGLDISEAGAPDLTVECDAGVAYDQDGQRMYVPSVQTVNLAVDSDGNSTDVNTPGNIKWLSVFLRFKQDLSNPKTDGNNVTVQYDVDESFEFIVEQSAEDVAPSRPALKSDAILLADIQRNEGDTTIENAEISTTRRQWAFNVSAGSYSVKVGQVEEAVQALLTALNSHVTNGSGAHAASAVSNTPAGNIAATTVQAALNELDTALNSHVTNGSGAHAASAVSNTPAGNIAATTVQAALNELDTEKGGLATANTWTAANEFEAGILVQPTSGQKYIKLRSTAPGDNVDETMLTAFFRYDTTFALGGSPNVTVIPAADVPNNCLIMISAHVMAAFGGNADVATWQDYEVAMYKLSGTTTLKNGGLEAQAVKDYSGTGGDVITSVAWAGNADGSVRLTFTAGGVGTAYLAVSGRISFIRVS